MHGPGAAPHGDREDDDRPPAAAVAVEADAYSSALAGLNLDVVRTGVGRGPNLVRWAAGDGFAAAVAEVGFPVIGRTTIADDRIVVARVHRTPPGTRWCGIDLEPGAVLMYGPGAEHTAVSPVGVEYTLVTIETRLLENVADDMALPFDGPARGSVVVWPPSPSGRELASILATVRHRALDACDLLRLRSLASGSAAAALADGDAEAVRSARSSRRSRHIVDLAVAGADTQGAVPSTAELRAVCHVSERRLRTAFEETVGMAPQRFLRTRFLNMARERLLHPESDTLTVEEVALDLGFGHLGRFASRYRELLGELPSATLGSSAVRPARRRRPVGRRMAVA